MDLDEGSQRPRFLIHDGGAKFSRAFDAIFHDEEMKVIRTPNTNARRALGRQHATRVPHRLLIVSRRQLDRVVRVYVRHYNERRPHRALDLRAPDAIHSMRGAPAEPAAVRRRDLLGGLIHEYEAAAA
jgi:putative transposase